MSAVRGLRDNMSISAEKTLERLRASALIAEKTGQLEMSTTFGGSWFWELLTCGRDTYSVFHKRIHPLDFVASATFPFQMSLNREADILKSLTPGGIRNCQHRYASSESH